MDKKTARARKGLKNIETVEDFENVLEQIMMTMIVAGKWGSFIKTKHIVLWRRRASPFFIYKI